MIRLSDQVAAIRILQLSSDITGYMYLQLQLACIHVCRRTTDYGRYLIKTTEGVETGDSMEPAAWRQRHGDSGMV